MSEYPAVRQDHYYGVELRRARAQQACRERSPNQFVPPHCAPSRSAELHYPPNDLSWYANIPVPTSYMCMGTQGGFLRRLRSRARRPASSTSPTTTSRPARSNGRGATTSSATRGIATSPMPMPRRIRPYIELMAGVYTDNQPDFSFLQPGETKTWSQFWYPIAEIGPAQHANLDAAISLTTQKGRARIGVSVTSRRPGATVLLTAKEKRFSELLADLAPDAPFVTDVTLPLRTRDTDVRLAVMDSRGHDIIAFQPRARTKSSLPDAATEPPAPAAITSSDELYLTGLHLEQYRHATRSPLDYWREALRRDPWDARCNDAVGLWHFHRGEGAEAEAHFRAAVARFTLRNPNPADGAGFYHLGLCLREQAKQPGITAVEKSTQGVRRLRRVLQGDVEPGLAGGGISRAGGDGSSVAPSGRPHCSTWTHHCA